MTLYTPESSAFQRKSYLKHVMSFSKIQRLFTLICNILHQCFVPKLWFTYNGFVNRSYKWQSKKQESYSFSYNHTTEFKIWKVRRVYTWISVRTKVLLLSSLTVCEQWQIWLLHFPWNYLVPFSSQTTSITLFFCLQSVHPIYLFVNLNWLQITTLWYEFSKTEDRESLDWLVFIKIVLLCLNLVFKVKFSLSNQLQMNQELTKSRMSPWRTKNA